MRWKTIEHNDNSLAVRLLLATGVIVHHTLAYATGGELNLPWVACFLVLSGYLVLGSRESSRGGPHFFWKRFLRIWPAMFVGFGLAFLLLGRTAGTELLEATFFYPKPGGGFWTISLEECLYLILGLLFGLSLYRYKLTPVAGLIASIAFLLWMPQEWGWEWRYLGMLIPMFFVGNLLFMNRKRIPWNGWIAAASLALIPVATHFLMGPYPRIYNVAREALFAYPVIWAALYSKPIFAKAGKIGDPSYSLFLYHWPILTALFYRFPGLSFPELFGAAWGATFCVALASWHLMESQALRLKNWTLGHRSRDSAEVSLLPTQSAP